MPFSFAAIWARRSARFVAGSREGYSAVSRRLDGLRLAEPGVLDEQPVVDQHPLLLDPGAGAGHGSRARSPRSRRDAPARPRRTRSRPGPGGEDGSDDCDVWDVGAAVVRVVEDVDVAAADVRVALDHHLDGLAHGAEVDRHVRGVGDQAALGVEDRAGEVQPLLDVDRLRGGLQAHAHLLGDRHEQVVEDLQQHRVGSGGDPGPVGPGGDALQQQVAAAGHHGPPAGLDHRGGQVLGDDGRAVDLVAGLQGGAAEQVHLGPGPGGEHADAGRRGLGAVVLGPNGPSVSAAWSSCAPVTSTDTASAMIVLPGMRKENRRAY